MSDQVLEELRQIRSDNLELLKTVHSIDKQTTETNANYSWIILKLNTQENHIESHNERLNQVEKVTGINKNENKWQSWIIRGLYGGSAATLGYIASLFIGK